MEFFQENLHLFAVCSIFCKQLERVLESRQKGIVLAFMPANFLLSFLFFSGRILYFLPWQLTLGSFSCRGVSAL